MRAPQLCVCWLCCLPVLPDTTTYGPPVVATHIMDHMFVASTTPWTPRFGAWHLCWGTAIAAQRLWFADPGHGGTYAKKVNHKSWPCWQLIKETDAFLCLSLFLNRQQTRTPRKTRTSASREDVIRFSCFIVMIVMILVLLELYCAFWCLLVLVVSVQCSVCLSVPLSRHNTFLSHKDRSWVAVYIISVL